MPKSMTGFGTAEGSLAGGRLAVEVRTVNHRHLNVQLRLPAGLAGVEQEVRSRLRERLVRGHVTVTARWTEEPESETGMRVNLARARAVVQALTELKETLGLGGDIDVTLVARQPDVLSSGDDQPPPVDGAALMALLDAGLDGLDAMRRREGEALARELERLLDGMAAEVDAVDARAPQRIVAERERLRRAVTDLLDGRAPDEDRVAQEIAILADKLDITEEIVRLRTHLSACREALTSNGVAGRQLGFLGQEMLREANTIGSKANDAAIAQSVVRLKGELDRFREQVENLE